MSAAAISAELSKHTEKTTEHTLYHVAKDSFSNESVTEKTMGKDQIPAESDEREYLTGLKLLFVLSGVILVCFLVALDTSIISTVSSYSYISSVIFSLTSARQYLG
jgi:hypothetical protein